MLIFRTVFPKGSGQHLFNCTATYPTRSLARTQGQWEEADHRTWQKIHCWPPALQTPQTSQHTYVFGSQELHPIGHLEAEAHQVHVTEEWRLIYQCHTVCPFRSWRESRDGCWCYPAHWRASHQWKDTLGNALPPAKKGDRARSSHCKDIYHCCWMSPKSDLCKQRHPEPQVQAPLPPTVAKLLPDGE